jgi:hypothetical protein
MAPPSSPSIAVENTSQFVHNPTFFAPDCFLFDDFSREKLAGKYSVMRRANVFEEERQFVTGGGLGSCRRLGFTARSRWRERQSSRRKEETTAN